MSASISVNPTPEQVLSVRGACPHDCPDTCALNVTVRDGVAIRVAGDPAHPPTHGVLCTKVSRYLERTYSTDRLSRPLRRVGPKGAAFYVSNPVFWLMVAAVAAIAALALAPARRYLRWRDAARRDPAFEPAAADAAAMRRQVFRAAHVVLLVLVAAPPMARGIGL